jgi:hemoglobin
MKTLLILLSSLALTLPLFAADPAAEKASLYERLGGEAAINAAVDLFYEKVLADPKVNHFFEEVNMKSQIRKQKEFLTTAFGGPAIYQGKDMRRAHKNLNLTEEDFGVIAGHLVASLKELKVDQSLIDEVVAVALSVKDEVLNKPETKQ